MRRLPQRVKNSGRVEVVKFLQLFSIERFQAVAHGAERLQTCECGFVSSDAQLQFFVVYASVFLQLCLQASPVLEGVSHRCLALVLVDKGLVILLVKAKKFFLFLVRKHLQVYRSASVRAGRQNSLGFVCDFHRIFGRVEHLAQRLLVVLFFLVVVDESLDLEG